MAVVADDLDDLAAKLTRAAGRRHLPSGAGARGRPADRRLPLPRSGQPGAGDAGRPVRGLPPAPALPRAGLDGRRGRHVPACLVQPRDDGPPPGRPHRHPGRPAGPRHRRLGRPRPADRPRRAGRHGRRPQLRRAGGPGHCRRPRRRATCSASSAARASAILDAAGRATRVPWRPFGRTIDAVRTAPRPRRLSSSPTTTPPSRSSSPARPPPSTTPLARLREPRPLRQALPVACAFHSPVVAGAAGHLSPPPSPAPSPARPAVPVWSNTSAAALPGRPRRHPRHPGRSGGRAGPLRGAGRGHVRRRRPGLRGGRPGPGAHPAGRQDPRGPPASGRRLRRARRDGPAPAAPRPWPPWPRPGVLVDPLPCSGAGGCGPPPSPAAPPPRMAGQRPPGPHRRRRLRCRAACAPRQRVLVGGRSVARPSRPRCWSS